ncbi:MAG: hypothetical protein LBN03_02485, partial [Bifidobacteriaceae bacterium]|nr:hypothetical protein [Bifidobacteriaceae bacterium]
MVDLIKKTIFESVTNKKNIKFSSRLAICGFALFGAIISLYASFVLAADSIELERNAEAVFGCDINGVFSCSGVAKSWQATIFTFMGIKIPNAFFGLITYPIFITIGVVGISGGKIPKWIMVGAQLGLVGVLLFAYWLFGQSMFVIEKMCPWCLTMMIGSTFTFLAFLRWNFLEKNLFIF